MLIASIPLNSSTTSPLPINKLRKGQLILYWFGQNRYVRLCHSREELEAVAKPCLVLATSASLEWGYEALVKMHFSCFKKFTLLTFCVLFRFARDLFVDWASDARNLVIFTERPQPATLAYHLLSARPRSVTLTVSQLI